MTPRHPFSAKAVQVYLVTILFYSVVYMVLMVVPFRAAALGASKSEIGLIMGATMLASMIARPLAGRGIDRHGTKWVLVLALLAFAISILGYFVPSRWALGAARTVQGIVAAFFSTAMEILMMDRVPARARAQGLSLYALSTTIPSTFGPALALTLGEHMAMTSIFAILFAMAVGCLLAAMAIVRGNVEKPGHEVREEVPSAPMDPRAFWVSASVMMLASVANGAIFTFVPLHLAAQVTLSGKAYFLIQTVTLVVFRFVGRRWIPSDGRAPLRVVLASLGLATFGTAILAGSTNPYVLGVGAICNGVAFSTMYPALLTFVSFRVPHRERGLWLGSFIGAADLGFALGALVMGPIADATSYRTMFAVCSALCLGAAARAMSLRCGAR